jgi:hypothetical protein
MGGSVLVLQRRRSTTAPPPRRVDASETGSIGRARDGDADELIDDDLPI